MSNLSRYERETIISFNDEDSTATVYTCNRSLQRKLSLLASETDSYSLVKEDEDSQTYECPKNLIRFGKPKVVSEEFRQKMRDLARERFSRQGDLDG